MEKNKLFIGISGKIGSGKTTFSNIVKELFESNNINCKVLNFSDKLKESINILIGYKGITQEEKNIYLPDWNKTVGQFLQDFAEKIKELDQDIWIKSSILSCVDDSKYNVFIIGDCRFENEVNYIKSKNGIVVRLNGDPKDIRKNSTRNLNHNSEISLDNYKGFDLIIKNNQDINALQTIAKNFFYPMILKYSK